MNKSVTTVQYNTDSGANESISQSMRDNKDVRNEIWILEDCLLVDVDFGAADYTSEDLNYITLTLQPTACRLENSSGREEAFTDITTK